MQSSRAVGLRMIRPAKKPKKNRCFFICDFLAGLIQGVVSEPRAVEFLHFSSVESSSPDAAQSRSWTMPAPWTWLRPLPLPCSAGLGRRLRNSVLGAVWRSRVALAWELRHSLVPCPGPKAVLGESRPAAACCLLRMSVTQFSQAGWLKDYALPNASWSQDMLNLYNKFVEKSKDGTWKRIPSYRHIIALTNSIKLEAEKPRQDTRIFLRNLDGEGLGFEYVMFFNPAEKRVVTVYQPGPYLEGYDGPILLGSVVLVDSRLDRMEGRKAFLSCQVLSCDGQTLHAEATALFIQVASPSQR
ncbi:uncharacterized protein LOC102559435 isoform X2 [Alligator mississippiensis]|uniref:uncharacterized protein LOC102559435 isoform X2 n=1 Tax=Alligator mississippiensis TaxID=8496 RepID=UPI00090706EB|nr:uncharacterized protein LOC102559435 isoform X2 [Alligator mississippiensis]